LKFAAQRRSCGGYSYLGVLFLVVFMGVGLAAAGTQWHQVRQREKERELLFAGSQFRQALDQYYQNSPGKLKKYPQKLENLLRDDRYPDVRRYLRRIYLDPMTKSTEWGLLRGAGNGIVGVYSLSAEVPVKTANFDTADGALADKRHYYQWWFVAEKGSVVNVAAASNAASPGAAQTSASTGTETAPAGIPQNVPESAAESASDPALPGELPLEEQRDTQCNSTFIRARTACFAIARKSGMASASTCFQAASTQYSQCLK
jgi:type II secretory pathway pseudopilin PulG